MLDPGGRVEGTVDGGQAFVSIEGRQCAAGQAWDACAPVVLPIAIQPTSRYAIDFGRSVRYRFAPLVQEALPDGTTRDRGRLDVRVDIRPGGAGDPSRTGWYVRSPNQREWQYTATVRYPAAGTATIGGRALRAGTDQSYRYLEFATLGQGPMP